MTTIDSLAFRRTRGMRDLLPSAMNAFRRVEDAFREAASHWGYEEIRTPTLETYSLFTSAGALTPQALSRVYSFLDWDGWSGERVVLRPDSTVPVARAALENDIAIPTRLFYVQNRFRFTDGDDDREDWQCGIEYLGAPDFLGELEAASVACETLRSLGMEPSLRLAHVGIARALIDAAASLQGADRAALRDRVAEEGLGALRADLDGRPRLTAFLDAALQPASSSALLDNLAALAGDELDGIEDTLDALRQVADALDASGQPIVLDLGMPTDFEYYTGVVFEFDADGQTWGRGGRYALPAPVEQRSACGLALDADALSRHVDRQETSGVLVAVLPASAADAARSIEVARSLHRHGIPAALESAADGAPVTVRVSGDSLEATANGEQRTIKDFQELLSLALEQK